MSEEKNSNDEPAGHVWSVASLVPGLHGLDLRPNQTAQTPQTLTELVNGRYRSDKGVRRRAGHDGGPVLAGSTFFNVQGTENRPWLYGWGAFEPTAPGGNSSVNYLPQQRQLKGMTTREGALVSWTGDRLFEYSPASPGGVDGERWFGSSNYWWRINAVQPLQRGIPAYLPTARVDHFDQALANTTHVDRVVGTKFSVVVTNGSGVLNAQIRDLTTGAWVARDLDLLQAVSSNPTFVSCVYSNGRLVVVYSDSTAGLIYVTSASEANPLAWTTPVARASGIKFDVEQITDLSWLLTWRDAADSKIKATYFRGETSQGAPFPPGTILVSSGAASGACAASVAPNGDVGLIWIEGVNTKARVFSSVGVALGAAFNLSTTDIATNLTVTSRFMTDTSGRPEFVAYYSLNDGAGDTQGQRTHIVKFTKAGASGTEVTNKFRCWPISRAFRVGDEVFCWLMAEPTSGTFQKFYFLMAGINMSRIIGACSRGTAVIPDDHMVSSRPLPGQGYGVAATPTSRYWSVAFPDNARTDGNVSDVRPLTLDLDFTPRLCAAEFGRAVYFAGAAVQEYDGREVVEAGFLGYPEVTGVASANILGGGLVPGDVRQYRVYVTHRNSNGEVTRSPALTFTAPAVGGGNNANNVTFTNWQATSRYDAWIEVYATTNGGSIFYLTSPAIASAAPANNLGLAYQTFADVTSDALLAARPVDPFEPAPGQAENLMTAAPPGCEILFSARDRIFMAGGDVESGSLAYTKQRQSQEQAGWSALVGTMAVDHFGGEITSLGETGDSLVVFLRDRVWAVPGLGPDNTGGGGWPVPTLVASGVGAVNHAGTVQTPKGLAFWSDSGPRVLSGGYSAVDISRPVTTLATQLTPFVTGAVSVPGADEVRWYTSTGTALLWDHHETQAAPSRWAVWDRLPAEGAVYYPVTGAAALALSNGVALREDVTGTVFLDAGLPFSLSWATAELRPDQLVQGHNRFRRFSLRGELLGRHTLGCWTYYDGSPMWRDYVEWSTQDNLEDIGWGTGAGVWNTDDSAWVDPSEYGSRLLDGTYRFRKRLQRQPAATLKLRFSDLGAVNDTALFEELAIEVGQKPGLSRLPRATVTSPALSTGVGEGGPLV